jgi:hypothetical protein
MGGMRGGDGPAMAEGIGDVAAQLGVHLFPGYFTKFGSPEEGLGGEKPRELMNRQSAAGHAAAFAGLRAWTRRDAPPKERRLSAARPKPPARKRGRKPRIDGAMREQLCLLLSLGYSRRQAAAALGIAHTTICASAKRDAGLAESLRHAEAHSRGVKQKEEAD